MSDNFFNDFFETLMQGSHYHDISGKKNEYENRLNDMWKNYLSGNPSQIVTYNEQISIIKSSGYKVFRNSKGEHKIVMVKQD